MDKKISAISSHDTWPKDFSGDPVAAEIFVLLGLNPGQIKPAPTMGITLNTDYLIGIGAIDERMLILVDIERLMSSTEMGLIEKLAA